MITSSVERDLKIRTEAIDGLNKLFDFCFIN